MKNDVGKFLNKCGSCEYLNICDMRGNKYSCEKVYGYRSLLEDKCYRYSLDENRDYDALERANSSDCYLTTVICDILGFDDDCEILNIMRNFRNSILQKESQYIGILMEYDVIGPTIASSLLRDENALWIAKELLKHYIKPIVEFIQNKQYQTAIILYQNMTNLLKESYAIYDNDALIDNYNQLMGGHGRVYTKVNY